MTAVFLKVLNMSISAGWLILAVILLRFFLKKAPRRIVCVFWLLVAIRLVCPFSPESALSLIPSVETVPKSIEIMNKPEINSGLPLLNRTINPIIADNFAAEETAGANPMQVIVFMMSVIWAAGMLSMLLYAVISYAKLKRSVGASLCSNNSIRICDDIKTPFILGIFKPLIYIPSSVDGKTLDYVITHETAHIKRRDQLWKPFGFLILTVYWFNPLCWAAYILLCRDIESACDEKVIKSMSKIERAEYSQAILDLSVQTKRVTVCPIAFGEVNAKGRIKSVLNYKKPTFWAVLISVIVCVSVALCFLTNPKTKADTLSDGLFVQEEVKLQPYVDISMEDKTIRVGQSIAMSYAEFFTYNETKNGIEIFDFDGNKTEHTIKAEADYILFDGIKYVRQLEEEPTENPVFSLLTFDSRIIRTYGAYDNYSDELYLWFKDEKELKEYYRENKEKFELDKAEEFKNALKEYNKEFFNKHDLILYVITESSGSIEHKVTSVSLLPSAYDRVMYFIQPNIKRTVPEVMTSDIAHYHLFIEIDKGYSDKAELKLPNIFGSNE